MARSGSTAAIARVPRYGSTGHLSVAGGRNPLIDDAGPRLETGHVPRPHGARIPAPLTPPGRPLQSYRRVEILGMPPFP